MASCDHTTTAGGATNAAGADGLTRPRIDTFDPMAIIEVFNHLHRVKQALSGQVTHLEAEAARHRDEGNAERALQIIADEIPALMNAQNGVPSRIAELRRAVALCSVMADLEHRSAEKMGDHHRAAILATVIIPEIEQTASDIGVQNRQMTAARRDCGILQGYQVTPAPIGQVVAYLDPRSIGMPRVKLPCIRIAGGEVLPREGRS